MYGTVAHCRVKPGEFDALLAMLKQWDETHGGSPKGYIASYGFRLDKDENEMILVAVFEDKDTYMANAEDPSQDEWYRRFRAHLESDPEWNDGRVLYTGE